ncbi:LacI family DNA-binding transcriptional regulator [Velocimicrobium porci]|uniref:LacI family transcriptional regulator n=1 Tax=Velocimicrobium porci TaxID=2606634 RepID=A0A6L5XVE3_9FIRM|nr:LacI family DNA-binding transcriptional regulator [Velocimicrobium porci]MSS62301.1 LacI family transcriptional regulator [Velocimicrobium porci]
MTSIRDVARLAGVSPSTVSRVMNQTANVNEEKKQKVLWAIQETGFVPNELARSLYKKNSKIIGVIVPSIDNPFFGELARVIEEEAFLNGYRLTLCSSNHNREKEKANIQMLTRLKAEGIILMTNDETLQEEIEKCNLPIVALDRQIASGNGVSYIHADHYKGSRLAMKHLLECGCKNIVKLREPQVYSSGRQRFAGYVSVCKEYGIPVQYIDCQYDYEDGFRVAEQVLLKYPDVDGILANNDMVAIAVYKVLKKRGYRVPEDVQLIGFDNIAFSHMILQELTTIEQPIKEMGKLAVKAIMEYGQAGKIEQEQVLDVTLIKRETTKERKGLS